MVNDFATTIKCLAEPTIDGKFNPHYGNTQSWLDARKRFGKVRVEKAVRDYRQDNPKFKNWRY